MSFVVNYNQLIYMKLRKSTVVYEIVILNKIAVNYKWMICILYFSRFDNLIVHQVQNPHNKLVLYLISVKNFEAYACARLKILRNIAYTNSRSYMVLNGMTTWI